CLPAVLVVQGWEGNLRTMLIRNLQLLRVLSSDRLWMQELRFVPPRHCGEGTTAPRRFNLDAVGFESRRKIVPSWPSGLLMARKAGRRPEAHGLLQGLKLGVRHRLRKEIPGQDYPQRLGAE